MGGGIAVKLSGQKRQQAAHANRRSKIQALMLISTAGGSPQCHVDFDVLRSPLEGMAASVTHELTEFIESTDLLLHGRPLDC